VHQLRRKKGERAASSSYGQALLDLGWRHAEVAEVVVRGQLDTVNVTADLPPAFDLFDMTHPDAGQHHPLRVAQGERGAGEQAFADAAWY
jgi:hypothetical protein